MNFAITLTFSTSGENHHGNQIIGKKEKGFTEGNFNKIGGNSVFTLIADAKVAVLKDFCKDIEAKITKEITEIYWDKHMWSVRMKEVQNKHARSNTIFAYEKLVKKTSMPKFSLVTDSEIEDKEEREKFLKKRQKGYEASVSANTEIQKMNVQDKILQFPDYDISGKGSIYNIEKFPHLDQLCKRVITFCKSIGYEEFNEDSFIVEGNFYFDVNETYIGFHGDVERKAVFGVRLGPCDLPLYFGCWRNGQYIPGSMKCFVVKSGSAYIMSEKAVGTDWMHKANNLLTLRHAAGNFYTLLREDCFKTIIEKDQKFLVRVCQGKEINFPLDQDERIVLAKIIDLFINEKIENRVDANWLKKFKVMSV